MRLKLLIVPLLLVTLTAASVFAEDKPAAEKPAAAPVASISSKHKSSFQTSITGVDKNREKARAEVAEWGPLTKKAADELRKLLGTAWHVPMKAGGWKAAPTPAGGMREIDVPGLGKREYYLHMPAQYTITRNFPLIISLHGAGGEGKGEFSWCWSKWTKQWPGLIACPSGVPAGAQWFPEQRPFLLAILADLRRNFAIDDDRIAIHGFSNGGNGAWYYSMHYPSIWCGVVTRGGGAYNADMYKNLLHVPCTIVHGTNDSVIKITHDKEGAAKLKELGYEVIYKEMAGGHEPFLDKTNPEIVAWLEKLKRKPFPPKIVFRTTEKDERFAYWIEAGGDGDADVLAEVKEPNKITLTSDAPEITLWLSDDLVDLEKPVTVTWAGKTVHEGLIPRSGANLLAWLDATGDRAASPTARLTVKQ